MGPADRCAIAKPYAALPSPVIHRQQFPVPLFCPTACLSLFYDTTLAASTWSSQHIYNSTSAYASQRADQPHTPRFRFKPPTTKPGTTATHRLDSSHSLPQTASKRARSRSLPTTVLFTGVLYRLARRDIVATVHLGDRYGSSQSASSSHLFRASLHECDIATDAAIHWNIAIAFGLTSALYIHSPAPGRSDSTNEYET